MGDKKIQGKNRGEEGTTPVTTAYPEAEKYLVDVCEKKKKISLTARVFRIIKKRNQKGILLYPVYEYPPADGEK